MVSKKRAARTFFNLIRSKSKYKLVNGLFIVRSKGKGVFEFVAQFRKAGSLGATKNSSFVVLPGNNLRNQFFNPKKKIMTNASGRWVKLSIGFKMKPISAILK